MAITPQVLPPVGTMQYDKYVLELHTLILLQNEDLNKDDRYTLLASQAEVDAVTKLAKERFEFDSAYQFKLAYAIEMSGPFTP